ncbi:cupin domain-containing protein [Vitreimonas flagellata]|uniref:cupin domain-containing protein n=1 Tax=Vitreimonas flagellata TaxID=2560861 RepID=UPI0010753F3C|nr:cupin domain-containing protein [Vitreimonas flagellata]
MSADEIIAALGMQEHPEGGHYVETFRDTGTVNDRARSTAIYFLLRAGERSHWHRVDATEIWLWHAGAPLTLSLSADGEAQASITLGPNLEFGERPQAIVPAHHWQAAQSVGEWTLVSCVVAPGFEFSGFELAPPDWAPQG